MTEGRPSAPDGPWICGSAGRSFRRQRKNADAAEEAFDRRGDPERRVSREAVSKLHLGVPDRRAAACGAGAQTPPEQGRGVANPKADGDRVGESSSSHAGYRRGRSDLWPLVRGRAIADVEFRCRARQRPEISGQPFASRLVTIGSRITAFPFRRTVTSEVENRISLGSRRPDSSRSRRRVREGADRPRGGSPGCRESLALGHGASW